MPREVWSIEVTVAVTQAMTKIRALEVRLKALEAKIGINVASGSVVAAGVAAKGAAGGMGLFVSQIRLAAKEFPRIVARRLAFSFATMIQRFMVLPLLAIPLAMVAAVVAGSKFEDAMLRTAVVVSGGLEGMEKNFRMLSGRARDLAKTTTFTANQVAEAMYELVSAGFSVVETSAAIESAIDLAGSTMTDLSEAVDITTQIIKSFNLPASDMGDIADTLVYAINNTTMTMDRLKNAMRYAAPAAGAFGQKLEDTVAVLAFFIDATKQGGIAGRAFRQTLAKMGNIVGPATAVVDRLGLSIDDLNPVTHSVVDIFKTLAKTTVTTGEVLKLLGTRAGPVAALAIKRLRDELRYVEEAGGDAKDSMTALLDGIKRAQEVDTAKDQFRRFMESTRGQFKLTYAAFEEFLLQIFFRMKPLVDLMAQLVKKGVISLGDNLEDLITTFQSFITVLTIFGAGWAMKKALLSLVGVEAGAFAASTALVRLTTLAKGFLVFAGKFALLAVIFKGAEYLLGYAKHLGIVDAAMRRLTGSVQGLNKSHEQTAREGKEFEAYLDRMPLYLYKYTWLLQQAALGITILWDATREFYIWNRDGMTDELKVMMDVSAKKREIMENQARATEDYIKIAMKGELVQVDLTGSTNELAEAMRAAADRVGLKAELTKKLAEQYKELSPSTLNYLSTLIELTHKEQRLAEVGELGVVATLKESDAYRELEPAAREVANELLRLLGIALEQKKANEAAKDEVVAFEKAMDKLDKTAREAAESQAKFLDTFLDTPGINEMAGSIFDLEQAFTRLSYEHGIMEDGFSETRMDEMAFKTKNLIEELNKFDTTDEHVALAIQRMEDLAAQIEAAGGNAERFEATWEDTTDANIESTTDFLEEVSTGFARAFGEMIFEAQSFSEFLEKMFKGLAKKLIADVFMKLFNYMRKSFSDTETMFGGVVDFVKKSFMNMATSVEAGVSMPSTIVDNIQVDIIRAGEAGEQAAKKSTLNIGSVIAAAGAAISGYLAGMNKSVVGTVSSIAGSFMSGFATGGPIMGGISAAIAGVSALIGWLNKPDKEDTVEYWAEEAGKAFKYLGNISDDLATSIGELTIELREEGVAFADVVAKARFLDDVLAELDITTRNYGHVVGEFLNVLDEFEQGHLSAKEATDSLNDALPILFENMDKMTKEGAEMFRAFVARVRESGLAIEELTGYIDEMLERGSTTLANFINTFIGVGDAANYGASEVAILRTTLLAMINEAIANGASVVDVLTQFGDVFARASELGIDLGPDLEWLTNLWKKMGKEGVKPLIDRIATLNELMEILAGLGFINEEAFNSFAESALNNYDDLREAGLTEKQALAAMAPLLTRLRDLQEEYGFKVDDATQALIDEAEAHDLLGKSGDTAADRQIAALDRVTDAVDRLADVLGGFADDSVDAAQAWEKTFLDIIENADAAGGRLKALWDIANPGGDGEGTGNGPKIPGAATGMALPNTPGREYLIRAHPGEIIAPKETIVQAVLQGMERLGMSGGGGNSFLVQIGNREIEDVIVTNLRTASINGNLSLSEDATGYRR